MVPNIGIGFKKCAIKEPNTLHELSDWEIDPGNFSSIVLFSFEKSVQFSKEWLELFN
jgi:hypothetical protein